MNLQHKQIYVRKATQRTHIKQRQVPMRTIITPDIRYIFMMACREAIPVMIMSVMFLHCVEHPDNPNTKDEQEIGMEDVWMIF